mmetsp:Transcript_6393/g.16672  ORF Transcript_6393/g.16672 Transcript_6393/m.16672 type:complete len:212 (+) Transcript_6393:734-1369(+)
MAAGSVMLRGGDRAVLRGDAQLAQQLQLVDGEDVFARVHVALVREGVRVERKVQIGHGGCVLRGAERVEHGLVRQQARSQRGLLQGGLGGSAARCRGRKRGQRSADLRCLLQRLAGHAVCEAARVRCELQQRVGRTLREQMALRLGGGEGLVQRTHGIAPEFKSNIIGGGERLAVIAAPAFDWEGGVAANTLHSTCRYHRCVCEGGGRGAG